jgi:ERCC4-type nuclease
MHVQIDSREKAKAIQKILAEFDRLGVEHFVSKLYVGDYMSLDNPRRVIDRKMSLSELYCNLCQEHKRFAAELTRAQAAGIELIILVEHGGSIKTIEDVKNWNNPRLKVSPYAWDGMRMYKTMLTVQGKYGVRFEFCSKAQTGKRIIEILSGGTANA